MQLIKGAYKFTPLKNDKERTITPPPSAMTLLREQKRRQAEWRLQAGGAWQDGDFVFTDELGDHLKRNTIYHQFKAVVKSIGKPETRFHDLRHPYVKYRLKNIFRVSIGLKIPA